MIAAALALAATACGPESVPCPTCTNVTAPEITCPANVTVANVPATGQAVSYTSPTATGGTPPVTTSCSPASGSVFPVGSTTVSCTERDAISRSAVCSFTVTLTSSHLGAMHFLAFGDSTTAGENGIDFPGDPNPEQYVPPVCGSSTLQSAARFTPQFFDGFSYPQQLLNLLKARFVGESFVMENEGNPGEQAGGIPPEGGNYRLSQCFLAPDRPDVLLLLEGINDIANAASSWNPTAQELAAIYGYLRSDVTLAASNGVSYIFVSTVLPVGLCMPYDPTQPCRGASDATDLNSKNDAVNRLNILIRGGIPGATIVDGNQAFFAADSTLASLIDVDGLHPTKAGYGVLSATWMNAISNKIPVAAMRRSSTLFPLK